MFRHVKQLQYTVRVAEPYPGLANLLLEQFGGPVGELTEVCRTGYSGLGVRMCPTPLIQPGTGSAHWRNRLRLTR